MIVSEVVRFLNQVPHRYPLVIEQGGVAHEILAAEYSHDPARAVLKIAEARSPLAPPRPDAKREIISHKVNPCNDLITLSVLDEPGAGGACHRYLATFVSKGIAHAYGIDFQNGPIAEHGVNGLTQEVLLAIVIDRLEAFQRGPFACKDNEDALGMIKGGLTCLLKRTQRRMEQGVEGTHQHHVEPAPLPEPDATIAELNGEVPPVPVPVEPAAEPLVDEPAKPAPFKIGAILAEVMPPEEDAGVVAHRRVHPEEVEQDEGEGIATERAVEPLPQVETVPTIAEQVVELAKARRTRKAKNAPIPPADPETT